VVLTQMIQGNHWCARDYGTNVINQNTYHYSNRRSPFLMICLPHPNLLSPPENGSYYYSNADRSRYYNNEGYSHQSASNRTPSTASTRTSLSRSNSSTRCGETPRGRSTSHRDVSYGRSANGSYYYTPSRASSGANASTVRGQNYSQSNYTPQSRVESGVSRKSKSKHMITSLQ
jgi:hypothetical protein